MTTVRVKWDDGWQRRFQAATDAGLTGVAEKAADYAARSMGTDHGGVPSKPGDPPNVQTSNLRNNISFGSPESLGTPGQSAYGTNVEYGRFLEQGTVKMRPRPWLMRAVRLNRDALVARFKLNYDKRMKGGTLG